MDDPSQWEMMTEAERAAAFDEVVGEVVELRKDRERLEWLMKEFPKTTRDAIDEAMKPDG